MSRYCKCGMTSIRSVCVWIHVCVCVFKQWGHELQGWTTHPRRCWRLQQRPSQESRSSVERVVVCSSLYKTSLYVRLRNILGLVLKSNDYPTSFSSLSLRWCVFNLSAITRQHKLLFYLFIRMFDGFMNSNIQSKRQWNMSARCPWN